MSRIAELSRWFSQVGHLFGPQYRAIFAFSLAVNVLLLVSPLYMLQIYDRVLSSGSVDSLVWLTLIAIFLLAIFAAAEAGRRRMAALAAQAIELHFAPKLFERFERGEAQGPELLSDTQLVQRLSNVFQNGAVLAYFDLPFAPLFLVVLFLLHPLLGLLGLVSAALIFFIAVRAEASTRATGERAAAGQALATEFATGLVRQRSAMVAMGIIGRAFDRWASLRASAADAALVAANGEGAYSGISKSARQVLQVLVLAVGAALVLAQVISPGAIVAASILVARALGPIDQITGAWRQLHQAQSAWITLAGRFETMAAKPRFTPLPRPDAAVRIDRLAVTLPGQAEPIIRPFIYDIAAGSKVAVVGNNGAGKTTLLQTLAGAWSPGEGSVSLGARDLHRWASEDRGQYVGYVPQAVELMPATVAENIARLTPDAVEAVITAARQAGAHEMILGLPLGYDTLIGSGGARLSAGQTQLIGLARAVFGQPVLLLVDEPTANLDAESAARTIDAFDMLARQGTIVIAATHDPRLIRAFDTVLVIRRGTVQAIAASDYAVGGDRRLSLIPATGDAA